MSNDLTTIQSTHVFANAQSFETAQRIAKMLSSSNLVPKEYQGNIANSLIALEISQRTGASPLLIMQNLYIVHGKPSWSSQFIIASINGSNRFRPLRFDKTGKENDDSRTCVAWTVEKGVEIPLDVRTLADAEARNLPVLKSPPISISIAKKEGWFGRNGSKWQTMPELMLMYRAATLFGRLYAPELLMGMYTAEEVEDVDALKDVTPKPESSVLANLNDSIKAAAANAPKVTDVVDEVAPTLQDLLHDIASAPTLDGLQFKTDQAKALFAQDSTKVAAITLAATERRARLESAAQQETAAAASSDTPPQTPDSATAATSAGGEPIEGKPPAFFRKGQQPSPEQAP